LAADQANTRRRKACLVFFDESGLSLLPNVRRSWAPRGQPPVLRHHFDWKRASMAAALCYGIGGGGAQVAFYLQAGNYDTDSIIGVLGELRRFLGGQKATLLWDGLGAHRSRAMRAFLATQRDWLVTERLPAYAPDLNPVEGLWANLKDQELANLSCDTLGEVIKAAWQGIERVRRVWWLPYSFLRRTGLSVS
jgi:transposase